MDQTFILGMLTKFFSHQYLGAGDTQLKFNIYDFYLCVCVYGNKEGSVGIGRLRELKG